MALVNLGNTRKNELLYGPLNGSDACTRTRDGNVRESNGRAYSPLKPNEQA